MHSGQYGAPGQYPPPGQYGPPPGQYPLPGQYPPPGQYAAPDLAGAPWGRPDAPGASPRSDRNTVLALVVAGVCALAAVGVALFLFLGDDAATSADGGWTSISENGDLPAATSDPDGLGEDPVLDGLAQACYDGDMRACDRLYDRSDAGSDYETYGDTCAGRQPTGTFAYCTETFPEE